MIDMELFHGTKKAFIKTLVKGGIRVDRGGGELGQGFYMGNSLKKAKEWAYRVNSGNFEEMSILRIVLKHKHYLSLKPHEMNLAISVLIYIYIRNKNLDRSFLFHQDLVVSPILGFLPLVKSIRSMDLLQIYQFINNYYSYVYFKQYKFESKYAAKFLNGRKAQKSEV